MWGLKLGSALGTAINHICRALILLHSAVLLSFEQATICHQSDYNAHFLVCAVSLITTLLLVCIYSLPNPISWYTSLES